MKKSKLFIGLLTIVVLFGSVFIFPENKKSTDKSLDDQVFYYQQNINQADYKTDKFIKLAIKILEITPSKTILKNESTMKVGNGKECVLRFGSRPPVKKPINYKAVVKSELMIVQVTPRIIKGKGIHLKIHTQYYISGDTYAKFNKRKEVGSSKQSGSEVIVGNYEEAVIELLENKKEKKKIILKLTPFVDMEKENRDYPGTDKFKLKMPILIMNDELINRYVSSPDLFSNVSKKGSKKGGCFIECIIKKAPARTFILSALPYEGMRKVGTITDEILKFKFGNDHFELISLDPVLPVKGKWSLYGIYLPEEKIKGISVDRNPYIQGKGGVQIVCVDDVEEYLPKPKDMEKYLIDAQALADSGKHEEALKRYIWFHNYSLYYDPAMRGVRLSFALRYWNQLGSLYPPAMRALKKVRDDKTSLFKQGKGNRNLFIDVRALNRTLDSNKQTVNLFRYLDQNDKGLAKKCWDVVMRTVLKNKQYDLAKKYLQDFLEEFKKTKDNFENRMAYSKGKKYEQHYRTMNQNRFVADVSDLIKAAVALGKVKTAKIIQTEALKVLDDSKLRNLKIK